MTQPNKAAAEAINAAIEMAAQEAWSVAMNGGMAGDIAHAIRKLKIATPPAPAVNAEPVADEFCWLVELFLPHGGNSLGFYHTGFTDLSGNSRSTADPHKAKRYATKGEAEAVAEKLGFTLQGVWRAVEHGFATPTPPTEPSKVEAALMMQPKPVSNVVPGKVHCAKCGFSLIRTNLYVNSGTTGPGGEETEPCPNDGNPLLPVTWEAEAREAWARCEELFERAIAAEKALATHPKTEQAGVRQFEEWLDSYRSQSVAMVFHEIVERYRAALSTAPAAPQGKEADRG